MTIYVVSGFMRSFSSMMMKALEAGGIPLAWSTEWDDRHKEYIRPDYHPNPNGFFELSTKGRLALKQYPPMFNGRAVKLLCNYGYIDLMSYEGRYKVVMLLRDPDEIAASYKKFFNKDIIWEMEDQPEKNIPFSPQLYRDLMYRAVNQLQNRKDVDLVVMSGNDVVRNPLPYFYTLKDAGWPIEPWTAASSVQPELYRVRNDAKTTD